MDTPSQCEVKAVWVAARMFRSGDGAADQPEDGLWKNHLKTSLYLPHRGVKQQNKQKEFAVLEQLMSKVGGMSLYAGKNNLCVNV